MSPKKLAPLSALAAALLALAACAPAAAPPPSGATAPAAPMMYGNGANGPVQLPPRPPGSPPLPKCQEGTMGDCTK